MARTLAIAGVARAGITRSGDIGSFLGLTVAGVDRTSSFDRNTWRISERPNGQANTMRIEVFGFTPAAGEEIVLGHGHVTNRLFRGKITAVSKVHNRLNEGRVVWACDCVDWAYELSAVLVTKKFTNASATEIGQSLVALAPGFSSTRVQASLATLDEIQFTMVPLPSALQQLADRVGGYWYVDHDKNVHLFTSESGGPQAIDENNRHTGRLEYKTDIEGLRNEILVEGVGTTVRAPVPAGFTTIPVDDASMFNTSGTNHAKLEAQRITYTGAHPGGTGSTVPQTAVTGSIVPQRALGAPSTNLSNTHIFGVAMPAGWSGYWCFTFYDADGETTKSPLAGLYTNVTGNTADGSLSSIDTGPSGTVGRRIYRTKTGGVPSGPFFRVGQIANNSSTTFPDNITDANLGTQAPPSTDTTGLAPVAAGSTSLPVAQLSVFTASGWLKVGSQLVSYSGRSGSSGSGTLTGIPASGLGSLASPVAVGTAVYNTSYVLAGATSLPVAELSVFPSGGGWVSVGNQLIRFTGRSGSSGAGTLTGIPSSGLGSIAVAITAGTEVINAPHLTGIPASGSGAIEHALVVGEGINVLVISEDLTSQGTYGLRSHFIQDRRLSRAGCAERGAAYLALTKDPRITGVSHDSTDPALRTGKPLAIDVAEWGITATVTVQDVTITPSAWPHPKRTARFASRSAEDLYVQLREIKERQQIR